jgi:membrane protein DedA with SNARE-associated domain
MTFEQAITTFGYPGVFVGTLLEGETALVVGGFLAHRGYLGLGWVLVVGTAGAFLGDQFCFWFGRRHGRAWLETRPRWHARAHRVTSALRRAEMAVMIGFRFVIGARIATPVVLGATGFSAWRFAWWNLLGSGLWAVTIGVAGYFFGHAVSAALKEVQRYELAVTGVVATVGLGVAVWVWLRRRRAG